MNNFYSRKLAADQLILAKPQSLAHGYILDNQHASNKQITGLKMPFLLKNCDWYRKLLVFHDI